MRCRIDYRAGLLAATLLHAAVALLCVSIRAAEAAALEVVTTTSTAASSNIDSCNEPLCYTASKLEAERNRIVLHDIDIVDTTRGKTHIKADLAQASGLDLSDSNWVLTGHVQVFMPQGHLSADKATVKFVNKRIGTMTAEGMPAKFDRAADPGAQTARGHAREITYDMEHSKLQLNGDSWITDGCSEINSQHILYDIASQRIDAEPGAGSRVQGTIRPRSSSQCASSSTRP